MTGLKLLLTRMNGWALSLVLHGGVALIAGLSVFSVQLSGGSGSGNGTGAGSSMVSQSFAATLRGEEQLVSGTVLPDAAQYGRLTEDAPLEPLAEELPVPSVPFDIFAVGASEPAAAPEPQPQPDPLLSRPGSAEGRATKLPATEDTQSDKEPSDASDGSGGSGGGKDGGNGNGEGSEDGNATGVYTPIPPYPSEARRRNIEGAVVVEIAIAADGSCALRRVVESSGFSPLDDAVQKAVSHWKYRPADADGRPEQITKRVRFVFKLGR